MISGAARLGVGLAALALASCGPVASGQAAPAQQDCPGVWVVVDPGAGREARIGCATRFDSGTAALRSAGFNLEFRDAMICRIDTIPESCTITMTDYWSYWHAARAADGSLSEWTYSSLGANSYTPRAGDVEGWYFGQGGRVPPQALPDSYGSSALTPPSSAPASDAPPAPKASDAPAAVAGGPFGTVAVLSAVACGAAGLLVWQRRRTRR